MHRLAPLVLVVALAVAGCGGNRVGTNLRLVTVPDVGGKSPQAAATTLRAHGLCLGVLTPAKVRTRGTRKAVVVRQEPAAGRRIPAGSKIRLVVSSSGTPPGVGSLPVQSSSSGCS